MKNFNYLLIIIGAAVAMYSKVGTEQSQFVLIGGIVILVLGIYRISKNIPSKHQKDEDNNTNEET